MLAKTVSMKRPKSLEQNGQPDVYDDGHLRVEHDNYYVTINGHVMDFPRSEFLIVSRLARSPERIVPAEELWQVAWGDNKPFNPVSLRVYIYRLRGKLEPFGLRIETMIGVGYRLRPAVSRKK
jgi:two-component system KDP operon response regulator KdpE